MRPMNDNDRTNITELAEYELPEWLAAEQEAQRTREAEDRAKIGVAVLVIPVSGLMAMSAIYTYAGGGQ